MARSATNRTLTDHDEIREWAEERGATPACVRGTGGEDDPGMIRLDFPGYSGADSLEEIDWNEWFEQFDENNLALLVQDETADGEQSNFNKLISRDNAGKRGQSGRSKTKSTGSARTRTAKKSATRRSATAKKKGGAKKAAASTKTATKKAGASRSTASSKNTRGSTRNQRTQTARGRDGSRKRAA